MKPSFPGAPIVVFLGAALGLLSVVHFWREVANLGLSWPPVVAFLLTFVPAGLVVWAGYRTHTSEIAGSAKRRIAMWVVAGFAVVSLLQFLTIGIRVIEGRVIEEPLLDLLVGALTGCLGGYVVGRRTHALRKREQELRNENDRLESVIKIVAHDLRNPLAVATGKVELARKERDSDHLSDVQTHLNRMETLIEETLTIGRAGDLAIEPVELDLIRVLEDCWAGVPTRDARLDVETDTVLLADESKLRQLLENLLRNAVEHGGTTSP
jgi:signal transduction histidine kinase